MSHPRRRWELILFGLLPALAGTATAGCAEHQSPATFAGDGTRAVLTTDAAVYRPGQPVRLRLAITNESPDPVTFRFSTGQRYDFRILDAGDEVVWTWSDGRVFTMSLGSLTLEPGETILYEETFSGDLTAGSYRAAGWLTDPSAAPEPAWAIFQVE